MAVYSSFQSDIYHSREEWHNRVAESEVRLQWDPDHAPNGAKLERRAIQLGLRGETLAQYANDWIVEITDISDFVRTQAENSGPARHNQLIMPRESVYPVACEQTVEKLRLEHTS